MVYVRTCLKHTYTILLQSLNKLKLMTHLYFFPDLGARTFHVSTVATFESPSHKPDPKATAALTLKLIFSHGSLSLLHQICISPQKARCFVFMQCFNTKIIRQISCTLQRKPSSLHSTTRVSLFLSHSYLPSAFYPPSIHVTF